MAMHLNFRYRAGQGKAYLLLVVANRTSLVKLNRKEENISVATWPRVRQASASVCYLLLFVIDLPASFP